MGLSPLVALVAINAVVDISAHSLVVRISLRFRVTVRTRKNLVVTGIGVARRAYPIRIAVVHGEEGMVPVRRNPGSRVVTGGARSRKRGGDVVRAGSPVVVRLVAGIAVCRHGRVVVVDVTAGARDLGVKSGERERRVVVIEAGRNPGSRVVAHLTLLRESRGDVIRTGGCLEILQMAGHACGTGQVVVVVDVALSALHRGVKPGQRESGCSMVEGRSQP